jgi:hypothetical protein
MSDSRPLPPNADKNANPKNDSKLNPTDPPRDFNDEIIQDDWWLKLTKIFHRLIGKD